MIGTPFFKILFLLLALGMLPQASAEQGSGAGLFDLRRFVLPSYAQILSSVPNDRLVEMAHRSDWNAWFGKPADLRAELLRRSAADPAQALQLSQWFLVSFIRHGAILGSASADLFHEVLALALAKPETLENSQLVGLAQLFGRLQRFPALRREPEKFFRLQAGMQSLAQRALIDPKNNFTLQSGAEGYARAWKAFQYLRALGADHSGDSRWLLSIGAANEVDTRLIVGLIEFAQAENFSTLREIYLKYSYAVNVGNLLHRMHSLRPDETLNLARERILNFNEVGDMISSVIEEIALLRQFGTREMTAALMPKILRLLELAEFRGLHQQTQAILNSLTGSNTTAPAGSAGAGTSSVFRWSDVAGGGSGGGAFSSGYLDSVCTSHAQMALELYRRGLIAREDIALALRDLSGRRCDDQNSRGAMLGLIASICDLAVRANDGPTIEACKREVLIPIVRVALAPNTNSGTRDTALGFLERLLRILPAQVMADLPTACRVRVSLPTIYNEREQVLREGQDFVFARDTSGRLEQLNCQRTEGALSLDGYLLSIQEVSAYTAPYYVRFGDELRYNWRRIIQTDLGCAAGIINSEEFRKQVEFINLPTRLFSSEQIAEYLQLPVGRTAAPSVRLPSIRIERVMTLPAVEQKQRTNACYGPS